MTTTATVETDRADTLRTGDRFRLPGTTEWFLVRFATRDAVFFGINDFDLDDFGRHTPVEVLRGTRQPGTVRIVIQVWDVDHWAWHATYDLDPTISEQDMPSLHVPYAFTMHFATLLGCPGPARYAIGTNVLLIKDA